MKVFCSIFVFLRYLGYVPGVCWSICRSGVLIRVADQSVFDVKEKVYRYIKKNTPVLQMKHGNETRALLKKLLGIVVPYSFGSFTNASNHTKNQLFIAGPQEIARPSHAIPLPGGKGVSQCLRIPDIQTNQISFLFNPSL